MYRIFLTVLFLYILSASPLYSNGMRAPTANALNQSPSPNLSFPPHPALTFISFFSQYISPIDGPRSPSYPTGSAYGKIAFYRYGFFLGSILTADRLIHESDLPLGPVIRIHNKIRFYDPVEANTFWWNSK